VRLEIGTRANQVESALEAHGSIIGIPEEC
jgi:hypothetical protein